MTFAMLTRAIWPERKSGFLIAASVVGLLGDLTSFLGNLSSPLIFLVSAIALAALFGWLCAPHLNAASEDGAECRECSAFRLSLYAAVALGLILLAGQGQTLTERVGAQLGLIQQDVSAIRVDTGAIREVTASAELIANPRQAEDFYHNAWINESMRRDNAASWREIQALYARSGPNKMDAAELYFRAGVPHEARDVLIARMIEIGRSQRDAAMLVVAARQAGSAEEALALQAEARAIDPDMPFVYWDQGVSRLITHDGSTEGRYRASQQEVAQYEGFLAAAGRRRIADYFFLPQYQADWEGMVRENLSRERERLVRLEERVNR